MAESESRSVTITEPSQSVSNARRTTNQNAAQASATNPNVLNERFQIVKERYLKLVTEVRLPTLDKQLFRKYVVGGEVTDQSLFRLCQLTKLLVQHKKDSMDVLRGIEKRISVQNGLITVAGQFEKGAISTAVAQDRSVRLLIALRKATLRVVEGIISWRSLLNDEFPFHYQGFNYLLQIQVDNHILSHCQLASILPLHLEEFPLASHLRDFSAVDIENIAQSSGHMFYPLNQGPQPRGRGAVNEGIRSHSQPPPRGRPSIPAPRGKSGSPRGGPLAPRVHDRMRLQRAEAYILNETDRQQQLLFRLIDMVDGKKFLPILQTHPAITPPIKDGVPIHSEDWRKRHRADLVCMIRPVTMTTQALTSEILPATALHRDGNISLRRGGETSRDEDFDEGVEGDDEDEYGEDGDEDFTITELDQQPYAMQHQGQYSGPGTDDESNYGAHPGEKEDVNWFLENGGVRMQYEPEFPPNDFHL